MKIRKRIGYFIAAIALITSYLSACATTAAPVELDAAKLAAMQSASWTAEALTNYPMSLYENQFVEMDENEIAYFRNIQAIKELDYWTYYALTSPEFPGTYYYLRKQEETDMFSSLLSGGVETWDFWKSTTIDAETFTRNNILLKAEWTVKVLESQPSVEGFEHLALDNREVFFVEDIVRSSLSEVGQWYEMTSSDLPGLTYYRYDWGLISFTGSGVYKRQR